MLAAGPAICEAYGIPRSTLRTWADRRLLTRHGVGPDGATLFDVAEVEARLGRPPRGCRALGCSAPQHPLAPVGLCADHVAEVAQWREQD